MSRPSFRSSSIDAGRFATAHNIRRRTFAPIARCTWLAAIASALACAIGPSAGAQDSEGDASVPPDQPAGAAMSGKVRAGVWLPRLGGDTKIGAFSPVTIEDDLDLDDMEVTPTLEIDLRKGGLWQLSFSGFSFETEASGPIDSAVTLGDVKLAAGDRYSAEFSMDSVALDLSFWAFKAVRPNGACVKSDRVVLDAAPIVGLRWVGIERSVRGNGARDEFDADFIVPSVGAQFRLWFDMRDRLPVIDSVTIGAGALVGPALGGGGGFHSGMVARIAASLDVAVTHNLGVTFGYRLLEMDVDGRDEGRDYEFTGGLQGLFIGGVFTF